MYILIGANDETYDISDLSEFHDYMLIEESEYFHNMFDPIQYLQSYEELKDIRLASLRLTRYGF